MKISLFLLFTTLALANGFPQLVKDIVKGHINEAVRVTKEQLGLDIEVTGQAGYSPSDTTNGKNLTFILSGKNLGSSDVDPFVKVSYTSASEGIHTEFGNTESGIEDNPSSPDWTQAFWFIWKQGSGQKWHFRVLDHKNENKLIGEGSLDVDNFAGLNTATKVSLDTGSGELYVKPTTPLKFKLAASNLIRSDEFNGKSDPYVKVYFRQGEHGKDTKFYTTSTIDNVENARWDDVIEFPHYIKGTDQYLRFKVRDSDSITKDDHLGEVIIRADSINSESKAEETVFLENSGEHSSLTIMPI